MQISIDITDRCNLNCIYCFKKRQHCSYNELSVDEIKAIYDKFEPNSIRFFGGEPTLRWNDILECIDYVVPKMIKNSNNQYIMIITNGTTNIDFETIPKEYRKNIKIGFSLDGFEEMTDKYRGKGTYKKVHDSVVRCIDAGIFAGICTTRTLEDYLNDPRLEEFIKYYVEDIGVNTIGISDVITEDFRLTNIESIKMLFNKINLIKNNLLNSKSLRFEHICFPCRQQMICIHTNGYINPRCALLDSPIIGHWTQWNKEDLIKLLNYCDKSCFDCQSKNDVRVKKFAEGLLKIRGEYYE